MFNATFMEKKELMMEKKELAVREEDTLELRLDSSLKELLLYQAEVDISEAGGKLGCLLEENPLLPGVILTDNQKFYGMISRQKFLECLSRPFGRELFLKRPIKALYNFAKSEFLLIPSDTLIVYAARRSLQRSPELIYEPIVVQISPIDYRILDIPQLLVAQSKIHEVATKVIRQQTQSQLIQTEKLASLGQLLAGVAHEVRNPVTCIIGNVDFLDTYFKELLQLISTYEEQQENSNEKIEKVKEDIEFDFLQEDLSEIIQSMREGSRRLKELVSSLHSFSHIDGGNHKQADIHECLESVLLILKNRLKRGIEVIKDYGDLPHIYCYSGQLSQVFMNLICNALDAIDEQKEQGDFQPKIKITTEHLPSKDNQNDGIVVRISDNGVGMPKEIQNRIFDMFFTTKPAGKGTGLGLAITHQIVTEKHGGKLKFSSERDRGTEFEVFLPVMSK